jgi:hypothetical protein
MFRIVIVIVIYHRHKPIELKKGLERINYDVTKVLSQHLLLGAEENHENLQDICSLPLLELTASEILNLGRCRYTNQLS